jgi:DNA-nicking Smr family endonuclease
MSDDESWLLCVKDAKVLKNNYVARIFKEKTIKKLSGVLENTILNDPSFNKLNNTLSRNFKIESTLDLHGFNKNQAQEMLFSFINHAFVLNNRNLLIITGKGFKLDGSIGVLRKNLPLWLNDIKLADKISSFSPAKNKNGGVGAYYVRLKNNK